MTEENIEIEIKEPADLMFEAKPKTPEPIAVTIPETIPEDDTVALLEKPLKPKAKKPRKPMSAEHKKKVLEALARGRATTKAKKLAKEKAKRKAKRKGKDQENGKEEDKGNGKEEEPPEVYLMMIMTVFALAIPKMVITFLFDLRSGLCCKSGK